MGLKYRFPESHKKEWMFWYYCFVCNENGWDALHHIISSTVRYHKEGAFNKSILNSCPIHNEGCHLYNEAVIHEDEWIKETLKRVLYTLVNCQGYKLKKIDKEFLNVYQDLYEKTKA